MIAKIIYNSRLLRLCLIQKRPRVLVLTLELCLLLCVFLFILRLGKYYEITKAVGVNSGENLNSLL